MSGCPTRSHPHRHMCSGDGQETKVRTRVEWQREKLLTERRREAKRGKERDENPKMVRRSNYDMPGHRRQCRGTCTHTLQNTL